MTTIESLVNLNATFWRVYYNPATRSELTKGDLLSITY